MEEGWTCEGCRERAPGLVKRFVGACTQGGRDRCSGGIGAPRPGIKFWRFRGRWSRASLGSEATQRRLTTPACLGFICLHGPPSSSTSPLTRGEEFLGLGHSQNLGVRQSAAIKNFGSRLLLPIPLPRTLPVSTSGHGPHGVTRHCQEW